MAPADLYSNLVLQLAPRAFWKMDDLSGLPQDSSGNGNHMTTMTGTQYRQPGPYGGMWAILFNAGQKAQRANVSTQLNNITWEAWVNVVSISSGGDEIFRNSGSGWGVLLNTNLKIQAEAPGVGTANQSDTAIVAATWYHLGVVREAGTWKYYRNGAIETANAGTLVPVATPNNTAINPGDFTKMYHSMVAVYDSALPESTFLAHYQAMVNVPGLNLRPRPVPGRGAA